MIIVVIVAAALLVVAIAWMARKKRTEHLRVQAGGEVAQREALTSRQPRPPQAEGDAMAAHSAVLQHQAQARHTDAATSHTEVNREFERADEIDPDCPIADTPSDMPAETPLADGTNHECP